MGFSEKSYRSIGQARTVLLTAAALLQIVSCLAGEPTGDASPLAIASLRSLPLPAVGAPANSVAGQRVVIRGVVTWLTRGEVTHDYCVVQDDSAGIWVNVHLSRIHGGWRRAAAERCGRRDD